MKIPEGQSYSVNQRTDNTMAKIMDKRTNNDLQNIHITKDRVTLTMLTTGENSGAPEE